MKEENKKCWNCWKYAAFYTKGLAYFNQEKIGMCREHNKIVAKQESCDKWKCRQVNRNIRKSLTLRHLSELLERFTTIEQIMKEEKELDKKLIE